MPLKKESLVVVQLRESDNRVNWRWHTLFANLPISSLHRFRLSHLASSCDPLFQAVIQVASKGVVNAHAQVSWQAKGANSL